MSWHVYLLSCADGTLYCGATTDLARRLAEHNAGTASKYTRARLPVALAASTPCADKGSALRLELAVKGRARGAKLAFLLGQPDALPGAKASTAGDALAGTGSGAKPGGNDGGGA